MGLIAARPEDPEEWAGLPSEPLERNARVDRLDEVPVAPTDAFGLFGSGGIESIAIPVTVELPTDAAADAAEAPDGAHGADSSRQESSPG